MKLVKQEQDSGYQLAKEYLAKCFSIMPVPYGTKKAIIPKWPDIEITDENFGEYFSNELSNIAIVTGRESTNHVDLDLDCEDAVHFSKEICTDTGFIYGRGKRPSSHRLYQLKNESADSLQYSLPGGEMIVELRGKNRLSLLPGSKGPEGDFYIAEKKDKPSPIAYERLKMETSLIAICVLCTRFWPNKGSRNNAALALAGMMYKAGLTLENAILIIKLVADRVGDEEVESRVKAVSETYKNGEAGKKIAGISILRDLFGNAAVSRLSEWLGNKESALYEEEIEEFNKIYAVVRVANKCKILVEKKSETSLQIDYSLIDRNDFFALNANKRVMVDGKEVELAKFWFKHPNRRGYNNIVFQPGKVVPDDIYNMWAGFNVEPNYSDYCNLILAHIRDVIAGGDEDINKWILAWLAQCVQYPYDKQGTALVLQGEQGTGKSILGDYLSRIFGKHSLSVSQPKHIQGNFNAHLMYCIFLIAEEAYWGGDKKSAGSLKDVITSKTMAVEKKGVDVTDGENHVHVLMTTNNDWAVPADFGERRFSVVHVSSIMKNNVDYFNALAAEMDGAGPSAFLGYLLKYDFSTINLREPVKTKALAEQIILGSEKLAQFIFRCLHDGKIYPDNPTWPAKIPTEDFVELFQKFSKDHAMKGNSLATYFGRGVKRYIPGIVKKKLTMSESDLHTGNPIMYTGSHPVMCYILPSLADCRKQFEKKLDNPFTWPEDD